MCGIAGLLGQFEDSEAYLSQMLNKIVHRGPDEDGLYTYQNYTAGMRRLSINDLKNGKQPLVSSDESVVVFYNGEIYNYPELRRQLEAKGKKFRTHSDGEVIPHLYEDVGEQVFELLDGMFAISIWDKRKQQLLLGRDLAGEKPLYYANPGNNLLFASEVKCFEELPYLDLTIDRQALWDMPTFLWIPQSSTPYLEVKELPRGHFLTSKNGKISVYPYRNRFTQEIPEIRNERELIEVTKEIVTNAVTSRLLSDVPVGSFLSGGLDSSIVATIAAKHVDNLDTFTIAFDNLVDPHHGSADESGAAMETAKIIGSRHHTVYASATYFKSLLNDFCRYGDMPWSVSSGLGVMAIAKEAREKGIKVLLNGDGADEAFGGYSWYEFLERPDCADVSEKSECVSYNSVGLPLEERISLLNKMPAPERARAWHYYASEKEKASLFSEEFQSGIQNSTRFFQNIRKESGALDYIEHDRNFYFPFEMLRKADRMTMAYSVEGRTPFASPVVQALVRNLKYGDMVKNRELKWVLRRAFEDILPMEVINRPKHGFNVPIDHWLLDEWADLVEEAFEEGSYLRKNNIVKKSSVDTAKKMLQSKERMNGLTIFSFIMLNKWGMR